MIFEICAILAVSIFAVLAYYAITTLLVVQRSLQNLNSISLELDRKIKQLDSTFNSISQVGDVCEEKTRHFYKQEFRQSEPKYKKNEISEDVTDLVVSIIKLGVNFLRR